MKSVIPDGIAYQVLSHKIEVRFDLVYGNDFEFLNNLRSGISNAC
jgi:hypothetical protein